MIKRILLGITIMCMMPPALSAETIRGYKVTINDENKTTYPYSVQIIEETAQTIKYEEIYKTDTVTVLTRKKDGATLEWKHLRSDYSIIANMKKDNTIEIISMINDVRKNTIIDIGNRIWIQKMSLGLQWFAKNQDKDGQHFISIWLKDFSVKEFIAKRVKKEKIVISEKAHDAVKVITTLDGWFLSKFWSNDFWFQDKTGLFLRQTGNDGPGTPSRIRELTN